MNVTSLDNIIQYCAQVLANVIIFDGLLEQ